MVLNIIRNGQIRAAEQEAVREVNRRRKQQEDAKKDEYYNSPEYQNKIAEHKKKMAEAELASKYLQQQKINQEDSTKDSKDKVKLSDISQANKIQLNEYWNKAPTRLKTLVEDKNVTTQKYKKKLLLLSALHIVLITIIIIFIIVIFQYPNADQSINWIYSIPIGIFTLGEAYNIYYTRLTIRNHRTTTERADLYIKDAQNMVNIMQDKIDELNKN